MVFQKLVYQQPTFQNSYKLMIINEGVEVSLIVSYIRGRIKVIAENITVAIEAWQPNIFQQDVFQAHKESVKIQGFVKRINEILEISGVKRKVLVIKKIINEALELSESILRSRTLARLINEGVDISGVKARATGLVRLISETVNVSTGYVKTMIRRINETVEISGVRKRLRSLVRLINEGVDITHSYDQAMGNLFRIINESISISGVRLRSIDIVKLISEGIDIVTSSRHIIGLFRRINETVNIIKDAARSFQVNVFQDVFQISPDDDRESDYVRGRLMYLNESISISGVRKRLRNLVRLITETTEISEITLRPLKLYRYLNENISINFVEYYIRGLYKRINEGADITDGILRSRKLARLINEGIDITPVKKRIVSLVRLITETVNVAEIILKHVPKIINEIVGLDENLLRARNLIRLLQENILISGIRDPFIFVERILHLTSKVISNMAKISKIIKELYFNSKI